MTVYLSAIKSLHGMSGWPVPVTSTFQIKHSLKSVLESSDAPNQKHPITYPVLCNMVQIIPDTFDGYMYKAAICLGFFAALRRHEYTFSEAPDSRDSVSGPILISNISFFLDPNNLKCFTLYIPKSKTTTHGFSVAVGCSLADVCSVCSLKTYLKYRYASTNCSITQPLFVNSSGSVLTKLMLNEYIKLLISNLGMDSSKFSAHSLRAGACTTAACLDQPFQEWELQVLGNWKSDTYKRYIRNIQNHTVKFSQRLVNNHHLG
jgi:hypothetical protein